MPTESPPRSFRWPQPCEAQVFLSTDRGWKPFHFAQTSLGILKAFIFFPPTMLLGVCVVGLGVGWKILWDVCSHCSFGSDIILCTGKFPFLVPFVWDSSGRLQATCAWPFLTTPWKFLLFHLTFAFCGEEIIRTLTVGQGLSLLDPGFARPEFSSQYYRRENWSSQRLETYQGHTAAIS